jgi:hypothetical protein
MTVVVVAAVVAVVVVVVALVVVVDAVVLRVVCVVLAVVPDAGCVPEIPVVSDAAETACVAIIVVGCVVASEPEAVVGASVRTTMLSCSALYSGAEPHPVRSAAAHSARSHA